MNTILVVLLFLFVTGLMVGVILSLQRRSQKEGERLKQPGSDPSMGSAPELLLGELTPVLAGQMPISAADRADLEREMRAAGYYRPTAVIEYAALRWVLVILPLIMAGVLAVFFAETLQQTLWIWIGGVVVAMLGYSLPRIYLYYKAKARQRAIEKGLPTAIDMMTLCLTAGMNVLNSLQRVSQEVHFAFPVLGYELGIVRYQAELRTLEFALTQFAERVGLTQLRNLTVLLAQSENLGTDAAAVLREYADDLRVQQKQQADEMANKAPFKLLFPAYLLALGAGILLVSPAALEIKKYRDEGTLKEIFDDAKKNLQTR